MSPFALREDGVVPRRLVMALALFAFVSQAGCVQRSLEFNCQGSDEADMEMTPTSLQFKGVSHAFREESGAWRAYGAAGAEESMPPIRFNPSSGELILGDRTWTCRKYEALLERVK